MSQLDEKDLLLQTKTAQNHALQDDLQTQGSSIVESKDEVNTLKSQLGAFQTQLQNAMANSQEMVDAKNKDIQKIKKKHLEECEQFK